MDITDLFPDDILQKASALINDEAVEILDEVDQDVHAVITDGNDTFEMTLDVDKMKNNQYDYKLSNHPVYDAALFLQYCIDGFADEVADYVESLEEHDVRVLLTDILTGHPDLLVEYGLMGMDESEDEDSDDEDSDEYEDYDEDELDLDDIEIDDLDLTSDEFKELYQDTVLNPENADEKLDNELDAIEAIEFGGNFSAALPLIYEFMLNVLKGNYPDNVKHAYLMESVDDITVIYDSEEDGSALIESINTFVDQYLEVFKPYVDLEEIYLDLQDDTE